MRSIIEDQASRDYVPVSTEAMAEEPLHASVCTNIKSECGEGDCDCPSGPDSGDYDND